MHGRLKHLMLATGEDAFDPSAWSGIPFSMRVALERKVERLTVFCPGPPSRNAVDVLLRVIHGAAKYPLWLTPSTLNKNARELRVAIERDQPDAVLSISSMCIAELGEVNRPVFTFSDAPFAAYAQAYEGTIARPIRVAQFEAREANAARRLDGICYSSAWAAREARRLFGPVGRGDVPLEQRLHVTPMGSNWSPKLTTDEVLARVDTRPGHRLDLLFLGRDWERKGGPLAVEVAALLHAAGECVTLHIVGCRPELPAETAAYVTIHGPLYRSDTAQAAALSELFLMCHFMLVPTLAECFGLAFAEAQASALPPVSRAVQALPDVVLDNVTGLLLAHDAPAQAYVDRIQKLRADPAAYRQMAVRARERYERILNWDAMADELVRLLEDAIETRSPAGASTKAG